MLNLLSFLVGITTILLIARYNKSNKLFWILLMSMMTGFIGGTVVSNIKNVNKINHLVKPPVYPINLNPKIELKNKPATFRPKRTTQLHRFRN